MRKAFFVLAAAVTFLCISCTRTVPADGIGIDSDINSTDAFTKLEDSTVKNAETPVGDSIEIRFEPLSDTEGLQYTLVRDVADTLFMYANGTEQRLLFTMPGHFNVAGNSVEYAYYVDGKPKYAYFSYSTPDRHVLLWFVDGPAGVAKRLFISENRTIDYKISDDGSVICVYGEPDFVGNNPVFHIYETKTMKLLKEVFYKPYRDKYVIILDWEYKDGTFTVTFGQTHYTEYAVLEIPVYEEGFKVLKTYSEEDE